ncbi:hypothetical protein ACIPUP_09745 [Pectobacterium actinidiae]|uniref:Uncharacterized protein n=1 Tax=Pectobacterium actinidiae TaxID=1507808 RepID=A0ABW8G9U4_9GAMM
MRWYLIEPTTNERFISLLGQYYSAWQNAHSELNALPLGQMA